MRLPSVSYWPPWQGQPKFAGFTFVSFSVSAPDLSVTTRVGFASTGPFGCTGHPRCAQRFERIVKLGCPLRSPFDLMYAVRRETSPAAGSSTNVVITNWPPGKSESGPRSTGWNFWPSSADATSRPTGGTVTTPPISAPRPSVEASRNLLRGKRSPGAGGGAPAGPTCAGGAGPAGTGSGGGGGGSCVPRPERSRTQRKPKRSAIAPPTATAGQLTIRPTRMHATPMANPTGQTVGGGR